MADLFDDQGRAQPPPHYHGHRKRLREKFLKNPKALADYEILELLLFAASARSDVKPLAKDLLKRFGSLARVLTAGAFDLGKVEAMNDAAIAAVKSVQEACSRLLLAEAKARPVLGNWDSVLNYCRIELGHLQNEQFRILFLNTKNMLIADEIQQEGTVNHTLAYPREIVKRALELSASAIILVHNHPSGDPTPSRADIDLTQEIIAAGKALELKVHDHLIISETRHYSFRNNGVI